MINDNFLVSYQLQASAYMPVLNNRFTTSKPVSKEQIAVVLSQVSLSEEKLELLSQFSEGELTMDEFTSKFAPETDQIIRKIEELFAKVERNTSMGDVSIPDSVEVAVDESSEAEIELEVNTAVELGEPNISATNLSPDNETNEATSEVNLESEEMTNEDLGEPNISSSNLMTEKNVGSVKYTPHPELLKLPQLKEAERNSIDMFMDKNKKMFTPAYTWENYLLSNVYQYQRAIEKGYEIKIQPWNGNEHDIPLFIEEKEFFDTEKNCTQRAIWGYKHLDNFRKDESIISVKKRVKGVKVQKYDAQKVVAKYYKTSDGYISKARLFYTKYHELYDLCYDGVFEFPDADRIVKFKESNPEFYSDLVNREVLVADINKYKKFLTKDNTLYLMLKSKKISFDQASKLLEIQNYDFNTFELFVNGEISLSELDSSLLHLKLENAKSDDVEEDTDTESEVEKTGSASSPADMSETAESKDIKLLPSSSIPVIDDGLVLSKRVRSRILDLAASQHKSADELLSELLDKYQANLSNIDGSSEA